VLTDPARRFYPIVDSAICEARRVNPRVLAAACLNGGARLLQIRVKGGGSGAFLALVEEVVAMARPHGALVIVNDRADIARMAGAHGVHVGQEDLPADAVRAVLGPGVVGVSTHDFQQVDAALASTADYLAVGPIYSTTTKDTGYEARGLDLVRYATGRGKPVVAIGGIDLARAPEVIAAGAGAVAVITDVLRGDPEVRTREYLTMLRGPGAGPAQG
jgi:thiamine-phosphate pyrophosphorylase